MKKIFVIIILSIISIFSYAQKFEIVNKTIEISKPIGLLITSDGESYYTNNTVCTIKNQNFGPLGNIIEYIIKCNDEVIIDKSFFNDENLYRYKDDLGNYNYVIFDDMFHYFQLSNIKLENRPELYMCVLLIKEIN